MSTPRDDDALSWGGDDDPTLDVGDNGATGRGSTAGHERGSDPGTAEPEFERADPAPEPLQPAAMPEPLQPEPPQPEPQPEPSQPESSATPAERHPAPAAGDGEASDEADAAHAAPLGNVGLVGIGMVAATFLLFAVGWFAAGLRLRGLGLPIPDVTVLSMTVGAALAPLVWFVTVLVLTRSWRTWQRFLLLIVGIVLLVPWPFLSLGVFA